jgi:predicted AAA+ superfamily ATPase
MAFLHLIDAGKEVFYWKGKAECDFLVRSGKSPGEAIQVCHTLTEEIKDREMKGLLEAMEKFKLKSGLVLTESYEGKKSTRGSL